MKFYTPSGVGVVRGDQRSARQCYTLAVKEAVRSDVRINTISQQVYEGEAKERPTPTSEIEEITLDEERPERKIRIGRDLEPEP